MSDHITETIRRLRELREIEEVRRLPSPPKPVPPDQAEYESEIDRAIGTAGAWRKA